jgi:hypothetical protein
MLYPDYAEARRRDEEVQYEASGTCGRNRLDCGRSGGRPPWGVPHRAGAAGALAAPDAPAPPGGKSCRAAALRAPGMESALLVCRSAGSQDSNAEHAETAENLLVLLAFSAICGLRGGATCSRDGSV